MGLLDGDISRAVATAFRGKLLKGYIRRQPAATTVDDNNDPVEAGSPVDYRVEGLVDSYSDERRQRGNIPISHMRVLLITGLCRTAPVIDDRLYLRRQWWRLVRLSAADPAEATQEWEAAPANVT